MARFQNGMRPIHPGEILREEFLVPFGMSANALAVALHVTAARINDIVRERRGVTPDTALRLARYFGGDAESWLNLQLSYDLKVAQREHGKEIAAEIAPRDLEAA
jgi:addiction module HigA family antidote